MDRFVVIVSLIAVVAIVGTIGVRALHNPVDDKRAWLDRQLTEPAKTPPGTGLRSTKAPADLRRAVAAKPKLWQQLVPPPPPEVANNEDPDLDHALEGVVPTYRRVGSKVFIKTPEKPQGILKGVGDTINGLNVKEITSAEVVFSLMANGREYTKAVARQ